ncbi:MAG TPA: hypothetical protein VKZ96_15885 [Thermomicrobiales bacterium]|nr:hypothetical protein [Thermomicrobiales bacterium]
MRNRLMLSIFAAGLILAAILPIALDTVPARSAGGRTEIRTGKMLGSGYNPRWFYIRTGGGAWQPTYAGTAVQGRLLNFRAANAIFDDEKDSDFDAQANTNAFISNLDAYKQHGIIAFTISLQGGNPGYDGALASAFRADGSLKSDWMARAGQVIEAADKRGQVVILGYFYFRQDQIFKDAAAVRAAVRNATDWIIANNYRNVIIEIANEHEHHDYDHDIIDDNTTTNGIGELIALAKSRFDGVGWRVPVSASRIDISFKHGLQATADVALVHGNGTTDWNGEDTYKDMKAVYDANSVPVVMNEDHNGTTPGTRLLERDTEVLDDALRAGGSWGLMWSRYNQYEPFEWHLGDPQKIDTEAGYFHAILDQIQQRVYGSSPPPGTPAPTTAPNTPQPGTGSYSLQFSLTGNRANPAALSGATVGGVIYPFVSGPIGDVESVTFQLDGSYHGVENNPPYDFMGGSTGEAEPWNTKSVTDGQHTIRAVIERKTGADVTVTATFTVANSPTAATPTPSPTPKSPPTATPTQASGSNYSLVYSLSSQRSDPAPLAGAVVIGKLYIFTTPDTAAIEEITFYLDGEYVSEEENDPYDFKGGTVASANDWNTTKVPDGQHTIEAEILLTNGTITSASASFTVANNGLPPTPTPTKAPSPTPSPTPHPDIYGLVYSLSSNRAEPRELAGATISGKVYVFTTPDSPDIEELNFYLDGDYVGEEENAPYDFMGGTVASARSWDTTRVADGQHTIEAVLLLVDGSTTRTGATFTVANGD